MIQEAEFYCSCVEEQAGAAAGAECLAEADEYFDSDAAIGACIDDLLVEHPEARAPIECLVSLQYDYAACLQAEGCEALAIEDATGNDFACSDGTAVSQWAVCDGWNDCQDGADEAGCPADHTCGDGDTVQASWVCDGEPDCDDASDEPADCDYSCDAQAIHTAIRCPGFPPLFENAFLEQCLDFESSEPGECLGDDCDDAPACEDGSCSQDAPAGPPASFGPARTRADIVEHAAQILARSR